MSEILKIAAAGALVALALLFGGCATTEHLPRRAESCALPDRLPALRTLTAGPAEMVLLDSDTGAPIVATLRYYRLHQRVLKVTFVRDVVALVDTDVADAAAPVYADAGLVDARGRVRTHGTPTCRWQILTPPVDA